MPKISIITPSFNHGISLERTILSVINQNYNNYEYIIIDGGSTDRSKGIIEKHKDKITYWVTEPDNGVYDAMNKGIRHAKGEYIYFLGADDILLEGVLEKLFSNNTENLDMIYGSVNLTPSNKIYDNKFDIKKLFKKNICHQAIFYKKELFDEIGLFNIKYKSRADYAFNIQVFSRGYKIKYIPVIIANFNETGLSSNYFDIDFWEDYKLNYIKPFKSFVFKKEIYNKLKRLFFYYANNRLRLKAIKILLLISVVRKDASFFLTGVKLIIKPFNK